MTHHWSFESLKFANVAATRELLEILYMVPPLYHLNRETWPDRKNRIVRHFEFWSPLHREVASAPLTKFEWLSEDRLVQRTTFRRSSGDMMLTANFSGRAVEGCPPMSVRVSGQSSLSGRVYTVTE